MHDIDVSKPINKLGVVDDLFVLVIESFITYMH